MTLTNGSGNNAAVNSNRNTNPYGHIVRFSEDPSSDSAFSWDIFMLAGDPAYDAAVPADQALFGSPDGIWVDPDCVVWIQTDISNSSQNLASRGYDGIGNNQMLAANPATGEVRRFLTGPRGCEITGVITTPDQRTMFVNVQHPGESTTHWSVVPELIDERQERLQLGVDLGSVRDGRGAELPDRDLDLRIGLELAERDPGPALDHAPRMRYANAVGSRFSGFSASTSSRA